jgi:LAS superfamily LD-carboxypeptidase LdcB
MNDFHDHWRTHLTEITTKDDQPKVDPKKAAEKAADLVDKTKAPDKLKDKIEKNAADLAEKGMDPEDLMAKLKGMFGKLMKLFGGAELAAADSAEETATATGDPSQIPTTGQVRASNDPNQPPVGRLKDKNSYGNLVNVKSSWGRGAKLDQVMASAVESLQRDAREAGFQSPLFLPSGPNSGYRPLAAQERNWQRALKKYGSPQKARKWVAKPGSSAHGSGRAIDFNLGFSPSSGNNASIKATSAYQWLTLNAHKYGLAPYSGEAWHWEMNEENRDYFASKMSE